MTNDWIRLLFDSWKDQEGILHTNEEIDNWIKELNQTIKVKITPNCLSESTYWYYDKELGIITNKNNSFFSIKGIQNIKNDKVIYEQPIIIQNEIGFLGIICSIIQGKLHFLMQAKIEPGNINNIQISPTIQATKSNFTQKHGGKKPKYLEYFLNVKPEDIIVDQIQSEQSSRFFHKRNRNIIIMSKSDIPIENNFKWMTLGQIKRLMHFDNIVNMDTRTVISCVPTYNTMTTIEKLVEISRIKNHCDISIEGREVTHWTQPLFKATGIAMFGLLTKVINDKRMFLIHIHQEIGCFDTVELGPSIQLEANELHKESQNIVEQIFFSYLKNKKIY